MGIYTRKNSTKKQVMPIMANDNGTIKQIKEIYTNNNGQLEKIYPHNTESKSSSTVVLYDTEGYSEYTRYVYSTNRWMNGYYNKTYVYVIERKYPLDYIFNEDLKKEGFFQRKENSAYSSPYSIAKKVYSIANNYCKTEVDLYSSPNNYKYNIYFLNNVSSINGNLSTNINYSSDTTIYSSGQYISVYNDTSEGREKWKTFGGLSFGTVSNEKYENYYEFVEGGISESNIISDGDGYYVAYQARNIVTGEYIYISYKNIDDVKICYRPRYCVNYSVKSY